ncbi:hypothetical protein OV450_0067 [Actinobacteria bacterium OV450]|nr:hypothetical protein OV450_0067 [Actinobacteria bacterium OV450]
MQAQHARLKSTLSGPAPTVPSPSRSAGGKHARHGGLTARLRRRLLAYKAVDFLSTHIPDTSGPGEECLLLVNVRQVVGQVRYRFCPSCACGVIIAITINKPFRNTGLGTRALSHLRARHPGTTWLSAPDTGVGIEDDLLLRMRMPTVTSAPPCPHAGPVT